MLGVVAAALLLAAAGAAQLEPPLRPGYVQWIYTAEQLERGQVTIFSVCVDQTPCVHVDPTATKLPIASWYEWKLPPLLVGTHTVTVQACNADLCGPAMAATFSVRIVPDAPAGVRVGGSPGGAP